MVVTLIRKYALHNVSGMMGKQRVSLEYIKGCHRDQLREEKGVVYTDLSDTDTLVVSRI